MIDELNLSPIQLDALREIGNVGAGNSATALSQIINKRIDMNVPKVALVPIEAVPDLVGGPDTIVVGVFLRVYGRAPGNILFLLPQKSAFYLVDTLMGREHGTTKRLDFMDESALMEIGNILSGAYLNAFFNFTHISMLPSIPALAMDMAGAILNVILVQLGQMGDQALVIETEFLAEDDGINGHFFLVPDPGSLAILIKGVGMASLIRVGMADYKVGRAPSVLISYGLGSCIGISLYDPQTKIGGLLHIMLPDSNQARASDNPAKFADTGLPLMLNDVISMGASKSRLVAKIAGGAQMFAFSNATDIMRVGTRNADTVKKILQRMGIRLIAEDTGGNYGRTVQIDLSNGVYKVKTIDRGEKDI